MSPEIASEVTCICGTRMTKRSHTASFDRWDCPACASTHFTPVTESLGSAFDYSSRSSKYASEGYLQGAAFRWAHRQALQFPWSGRRTLEIGCFNGFMVKALREAGADAAGFDVNVDAIEVGQRIFALPQNSLFSDWNRAAESGPYDDILCFDVLEHLEDPRAFIASLAPLLNKNASLLLAGPTAERGFHDKSDFPPHHRWWFSQAGIRKMMQSLGYSEEHLKVERNPVLLARNVAGRLLHGYGLREFHGDTVMSGDALDNGLIGLIYRTLERVGQWIFSLLNLQYCSALFVFRAQSPKR